MVVKRVHGVASLPDMRVARIARALVAGASDRVAACNRVRDGAESAVGDAFYLSPLAVGDAGSIGLLGSGRIMAFLRVSQHSRIAGVDFAAKGQRPTGSF